MIPHAGDTANPILRTWTSRWEPSGPRTVDIDAERFLRLNPKHRRIKASFRLKVKVSSKTHGAEALMRE